MKILFSVTGKTKNSVTNTTSYLFNTNRVKTLTATGTDSLIEYQETKSQIAKWVVDETYAAISAQIDSYEAGRSIPFSILTKDGVTSNITETLNVDNFIYVYANPSDATQSIIYYEDPILRHNTRILVTGTLAAITTLVNDTEAVDMYKGVIDCSGNPNYPACEAGGWYYCSVQGKIGGASGVSVQVGDRIVCRVTNAGGTEAAVGTSWFVNQTNINIKTTGTYYTTFTPEDNDSTVTLDNATFEVEHTASATQRLIKLATGTDANATLTLEGTSSVINQDVTTDNKPAFIGVTLNPTAGLEAITIDANTIKHTTGNIIGATIGVNSIADVNFINATIAVDSSLTGAEVVKGINLTLTGKAADADGTGLIGNDITLTTISTSRADRVGYTVTFAGTRDTADLDRGYILAPGGVLNNANAAMFGYTIDFSSLTHTDGAVYGNWITLQSTITAGTEIGYYVNACGSTNATGISIINDRVAENSASTGLKISKGITNDAASGALALTNNAIQITSTNASSALASGGITATNTLVSISKTGANSTAAQTDTYGGNIMLLTYTVDNTSTGAIATDGVALNIDYNIAETAGTTTVNPFGIINIDFDVSNTPVFSNGSYNLINVNGSSNAASPAYAASVVLSGVKVDLENMVGTDTDLTLYGLNVAMPTGTGTDATEAVLHGTSGGNTLDLLLNSATNSHVGVSLTMVEALSVGIVVTSDSTLANGKQNITTSRDITGTVAGAVALTNFANTFAQEVGHTGGDFIVTQTATTAGVLNLVLAHTTSIATTAPDVFASTALNIDVDATTAGDAGADLDVTARALDITYNLTETLGVLRMGSTDIARISATIPNGLSSAGAFNFDILELNADSVVLNDANIDFKALNIDASGLTNTLSASSYGLSISVPNTVTSAAVLTNASNTLDLCNGTTAITISGTSTIGINLSGATTSVNLSADGTVANARQTLVTSRDINGTVAGAVDLTAFANTLGQAVSHTGGDFVVTQTANTAGILNLVLEHTANIGAALTAPDIFSSTGLLINVAGTVAGDAAAKLDMAARAIDVTYSITETLGVARLASTDITKITLTVPAGITSAGAYNFNILNLDGSGYVGNDANTTLRGVNIDLGHSAAAAELTGVYIDAGGAGTIKRALYATDGTQVLSLCNGASHIVSTATLITDMPVTAPGVGFDTAGGVYVVPFGKRGVGGMIVTEIYVDLGNAAVSSKNTLNDIIGEAAGGAAYIGRITAANNGTVVAIEVVCLEAPATGDTDIDISAATAADGAYDADVTALAGYAALLTAGAAWTDGMVKVATALPAADTYLYLSSGNGGVAGAYSTGKFIIRIYGV